MFRFTIRDVLWLTVVVALGIMWCGEYRQRMSDSAELRANYQQVLGERDRLLKGRNPAWDMSHRDLEAVNLKLQQQNLLYKKLVETYEAERTEIRKAVIGRAKTSPDEN